MTSNVFPENGGYMHRLSTGEDSQAARELSSTVTSPMIRKVSWR